MDSSFLHSDVAPDRHRGQTTRFFILLAAQEHLHMSFQQLEFLTDVVAVLLHILVLQRTWRYADRRLLELAADLDLWLGH